MHYYKTLILLSMLTVGWGVHNTCAVQAEFHWEAYNCWHHVSKLSYPDRISQFACETFLEQGDHLLQ